MKKFLLGMVSGLLVAAFFCALWLMMSPVTRDLSLAKVGSAAAQSRLSTAYFYGQGVPQNYDLAYSWASKALTKWEPEALWLLGTMYYFGLGVVEDKGQGAEYIRFAAHRGWPAAVYGLGIIHLEQREYEEAQRWFKQAVSLGEWRAAVLMDMMQCKGWGGAHHPASLRGEPWDKMVLPAVEELIGCE
jgi:TPR repeat protein